MPYNGGRDGAIGALGPAPGSDEASMLFDLASRSSLLDRRPATVCACSGSGTTGSVR